MRARRVLQVLTVAGFFTLMGAAPVFADVDVTVPASGEELPLDNGSVVISGTVSTANEIIVYVDGIFITCDGTTRTDPNDFGDDGSVCWHPPLIEAGTWTWRTNEDELALFSIPLLGDHTFEFVEWMYGEGGPGSRVSSSTVSVTVVPQHVVPVESEPIVGTDPPVAVSHSASAIATGDAAAPSVMSALQTLQSLRVTPFQLICTAVVTVILMLIVGFPGQLIGSTVSENYDRIFGWTKPIAKGLGDLKAATNPPPPWVPITIGVTLATLISGFVDPGFGPNPGSLRLLLSLGCAFVIDSVLGWFVIRRALRRTDPDLKPTLRFRFGSLFIVLLSVIITRLVGFEPGMVFGLVVGLSFGAMVAATKRARVVLLGLAWSFALAIVGWLTYSLLQPALGGSDNVVGTFVLETLASVAVAGIAALPIALFPLAIFDGGSLFAWNRLVWGGCYALGLFIFIVILMPMPRSWGSVGLPLGTWIALYALYGLAALGLWLYFRLTAKKKVDVNVDA